MAVFLKILREGNTPRLVKLYGFEITVVPSDFSAEDALKLNPDGLFLSNGPGDPDAVRYAV
ncbi:MAG: hypothetical protein HY589_02960, partial [Candidatus Omnitrophica bacterium]|nr:hypothetical protein [Candidatus Omnitrophota bacterium]